MRRTTGKCLLTNWRWYKSFCGVLETIDSHLKEQVHQYWARFMLPGSLDHQLFCIHGLKLLLRNMVSLLQEWFIALHMHYLKVSLPTYAKYSIPFCLSFLLIQLLESILTVSHAKKYLLINILLIFGLKNAHNHKRAKVIFQNMYVVYVILIIIYPAM